MSSFRNKSFELEIVSLKQQNTDLALALADCRLALAEASVDSNALRRKLFEEKQLTLSLTNHIQDIESSARVSFSKIIESSNYLTKILSVTNTINQRNINNNDDHRSARANISLRNNKKRPSRRLSVHFTELNQVESNLLPIDDLEHDEVQARLDKNQNSDDEAENECDDSDPNGEEIKRNDEFETIQEEESYIESCNNTLLETTNKEVGCKDLRVYLTPLDITNFQNTQESFNKTNSRSPYNARLNKSRRTFSNSLNAEEEEIENRIPNCSSLTARRASLNRCQSPYSPSNSVTKRKFVATNRTSTKNITERSSKNKAARNGSVCSSSLLSQDFKVTRSSDSEGDNNSEENYTVQKRKQRSKSCENKAGRTDLVRNSNSSSQCSKVTVSRSLDNEGDNSPDENYKPEPRILRSKSCESKAAITDSVRSDSPSSLSWCSKETKSSNNESNSSDEDYTPTPKRRRPKRNVVRGSMKEPSMKAKMRR